MWLALPREGLGKDQAKKKKVSRLKTSFRLVNEQGKGRMMELLRRVTDFKEKCINEPKIDSRPFSLQTDKMQRPKSHVFLN